MPHPTAPTREDNGSSPQPPLPTGWAFSTASPIAPVLGDGTDATKWNWAVTQSEGTG